MHWDEIKNTMTVITDPVEKLEMVMELGKSLPKIPENCETYEIKGCASRVEICAIDNKFYGSADSALVRGLVAIILSRVQGMNADEIKKIDLISDFESLDLNLGAGRINGVNSMISFLQNL